MPPRQRSARNQEPNRPPEQPAAPAAAMIRFDPVAAGRDLKTAIEQRRPQLAALLGLDLDSERGRAMLERFVTVALHAATSRPDLLRATKESLVEAIRDSAMLGLEPVGATGDGAIVVYDEKQKVERPGRTPGSLVIFEEAVPTAHFQPMYRGLLKLARRSDKIAQIDAHVVYHGDVIELDLGSSPSVRHLPVLDGTKRGGYVGAYAVAELTNGRRYVDWMTEADIEVVRKKSRARNAMAWSEFWPEMARKTVLRRLLKRLPLESLAEHALRLENESEERALPPVVEVMESDARHRLRARFGLGSGGPATEAGPALAAGEPAEGTTEAPHPAGDGSVAPTGSQPPEPTDADVAAVARGVSEDATPAEKRAGREALDRVNAAAAREICGAETDPEAGPVQICVKDPGHANPDGSRSSHEGDAGARWPNPEPAEGLKPMPPTTPGPAGRT